MSLQGSKSIAQGKALGNIVYYDLSPVRAMEIVMPLQGLVFFRSVTQGVALGYAPQALRDEKTESLYGFIMEFVVFVPFVYSTTTIALR